MKSRLKALIPEEILFDDCIVIGALNEVDEVKGVLLLKRAAPHIWDIPFIYVATGIRRNRVGHNMLIYAKTLARSSGVKRFTISYIDDKTSTDLYSFFSYQGFFEIDSSNLYKIPMSVALNTIISNDVFSKLRSDMITPLSSISDAQWKQVTDAAARLSLQSDDTEFFPIPHGKAHYNGDFSFIATKEDHTPTGVVLCSIVDEVLNIDYLISLDPGNPMVSALLIRALCKKAGSGYTDYEVHFHAYNPRIMKLANYLLGQKLTMSGRFLIMGLRL